MSPKYWDSLSLEAIKMHAPDLESKAYNNIGIILKERGEILDALDFYHKSLIIEEGLGNKEGISTALNNIGVLHDNMGDVKKAISFYRRSLAISKELNSQSLGDRYWNMAAMFPKNIDSNTFYLRLAGDAYFEMGGDYGMGSYHYVLGTIQFRDSLYDISLGHFKKAAEMYHKMGHMNYVIRSQNYVAWNYFHLKMYKEAEFYADSSLSLSYGIENVLGIMNASEVLFEIQNIKGNYKEALNMFQLNQAMKDSVNNNKLLSSTIRKNMAYEYAKEKAIRETELRKERELINEKDKRQTQLIFAAIIGFLFMLIFAFFIQNRLKLTRKQRDIIDYQKQELTDSIQYAKRIQSAILPPSKLLKKHLKEFFVLYKPKDIVAGDFYWMEHKENIVLFAAADCTGHGVPGAMVSVVCNNALKRSVREHGLTDPGEILTKTREIVIQEFEKSEEEVKDGMDIALCSLEGNKLQYAGAHNPLWIIRKGGIIETKANKQPIGQFDNPEPYTTHSFNLEHGDSIFVFSDGYVDQFGGEKGKKFKAKAFRDLLLSIQDKSMEEQKTIIDEAFETWRGNLEQIDDVCVIGVRV